MTALRISNGLSVAMILVAMACVPPRGGWDIERLVAAESSIAALEGQRLGDMLPFPALDGERIVLLACRFAPNERVTVRGGGPQWPSDWGAAAVRALDRSVEAVELVLESDDDVARRIRPKIEIVTIQAVGGEGPRGLGDTLTECDVSPVPSTSRKPLRTYRGVLVGAEIRMRRTQLDLASQIRNASAEEWVGALMHELAHGLGFAGHAAVGRSILVRDESRIRAAGRRALTAIFTHDETLEALYRLRPGQRLGSRRVNDAGASWLVEIEKLVRARVSNGRAVVGMFSSVGDKEARLVWRHSDGSQLGIRMPHWRRELRSGSTITVRPDRTTRRRVAIAAETED
jgi:hypothetical protein